MYIGKVRDDNSDNEIGSRVRGCIDSLYDPKAKKAVTFDATISINADGSFHLRIDRERVEVQKMIHPENPLRYRTVTEFVALFKSIKKDDPALPVPKANQLFAFLDILRRCELDTDNLMAMLSEHSGLEIRINQETLAKMSDHTLKHLVAFGQLDHLVIDNDPNYADDTISCMEFDQVFPEDATTKVVTAVFDWRYGWPSESEILEA